MDLDAFKAKLMQDEKARIDFIADVQAALQKQGVNIHDTNIMKKYGFTKDLKDPGNVTSASSAIITIIN